MTDSAHPTMNHTMTDLKSYGENVAAIAAMVHENKETYQEIYDLLADKVGGFVGIWSICADAAEVFSNEEAIYTAGEDFYWIEAIDDYAHKIICYLQTSVVPSTEDMHRLAAGAIEGCFINR